MKKHLEAQSRHKQELVKWRQRAEATKSENNNKSSNLNSGRGSHYNSSRGNFRRLSFPVSNFRGEEPLKTETPNRKVYSLSPVATVEYIRSQMRENNTSWVRSAQNYVNSQYRMTEATLNSISNKQGDLSPVRLQTTRRFQTQNCGSDIQIMEKSAKKTGMINTTQNYMNEEPKLGLEYQNNQTAPKAVDGFPLWSLRSLRKHNMATGPETWCPQESFATSTPLRHSNESTEPAGGIFTHDLKEKGSVKSTSRVLEAESREVKGQGQKLLKKDLQVPENVTRVNTSENINYEKMTHKNNLIQPGLEVCGHRKVESVPDGPVNTPASKDVWHVPSTNQSQVEPSLDNIIQHTPLQALDISPIPLKAFTEVQKLSVQDGTKPGQAARSAPETGRSRAHASRLRPINLFPEYTASKEYIKAEWQNAVIQHSGNDMTLNLQLNNMNSLSKTVESSVGTQRKRDAFGTNSKQFSLQKGYTNILVQETLNKETSTNLLPSVPRHARVMPGHAPAFVKMTSKGEDIPDFRYSDFSKLSSNLPSQRNLVTENEVRRRRASLGVICMKSRDIAAVYSRNYFPMVEPGLGHDLTAQHQISRALSVGGRDKRSSQLKQPEIDLKQSSQTSHEGISNFTSDLRRREQENQEVNPRQSPEGIVATKTVSDSQFQSQQFNFQDEEFYSAETFLENLQQSYHNFSSHGSPFSSKDLTLESTRGRIEGTENFKNKGSQRRETMNHGLEQRSCKFRGVGADNRRQSLPLFPLNKTHMTDQTRNPLGQHHKYNHNVIGNFQDVDSHYKGKVSSGGKKLSSRLDTLSDDTFFLDDYSSKPQSNPTLSEVDTITINGFQRKKQMENYAFPPEEQVLSRKSTKTTKASRKLSSWQTTDTLINITSGKPLGMKLPGKSSNDFAEIKLKANNEPKAPINGSNVPSISEQTRVSAFRPIALTRRRVDSTRRYTMHNLPRHEHTNLFRIQDLPSTESQVDALYSEWRSSTAPPKQAPLINGANQYFENEVKNNFRTTPNLINSDDFSTKTFNADCDSRIRPGVKMSEKSFDFEQNMTNENIKEYFSSRRNSVHENGSKKSGDNSLDRMQRKAYDASNKNELSLGFGDSQAFCGLSVRHDLVSRQFRDAEDATSDLGICTENGSSVATSISTNFQPSSPKRSHHLTSASTSTASNSDLTGASPDFYSMEKRKGAVDRNRNVFRGSVFISLLVESHPSQFPSRTAACRFGRRLFREELIRSIFGAKNFEDSAQLYVWQDQGQTGSDNGRNMTSPASTSESNSNSKSEKKSHKQLDWQLIEDIRNRLLNRSEAYNIVTSYNTFYQELQQDFGFDHNSSSNKKSPLGGSDIAWSGTNTPYTSTLEHKKDQVCSIDSSLDNQIHTRETKESGKNINIPKHPSTGPNCKFLVAKDSSPDESNAASVNLKKHKIHSIPPYHPIHQHHQSNPEILTMPTGNMNSEQTAVLENRQFNTNFQSEQQPHALSPQVGSMIQGSTAVGQKTSAAAENLEGNNIRNFEPVHSRSNERWPQEALALQSQPVVSEAQRWLNPATSHSGLNEPWNLQNNRTEGVHGLVDGSRSRWHDNVDNGRRWPESTYSYSDNEKQLLEEMRRMKKEHQNVLRTYEGRINKLMAKMHELRNIAEMLEHSSNKSSPYGILPGKLALLNILGGQSMDGKNVTAKSAASEADQVPPPLPPRPSRGSRVYPNKPIIHTSVTMKPLPWSRIILQTDAQANTVWHGMKEPSFDTEELERLFTGTSDFPCDVNLHGDICLRRGRNQAQLVAIYDAERSQRITSELRALRCTLPEVIQAFVTLNCDSLHTDSFAELLELLTSPRELDKIFHHVKRKGASQLDIPEYLVYELSKIDHFRERLEFLRFKNKIQINLFEIDQQLRELHTACEEITSSVALKHVLETVLAVGNHMNAGTERGQADGFKVDILNSLKDMQNQSKQGNLLELIMRIYCLKFESDLDFGCPTRFRLPEPSNMRHAAQVSFEDIQRALKELKDEMSLVRNKLESLSKLEGSTLTIALRVTSENFMSSAVEVLASEEKLLEDTRAQFRKTVIYFSNDGQKSTPHEFFEIWASFLHDCKYYWKLAHRNLAKLKFHADLTSKCQLSSSSLPGYNSLKSAMIKHVASFQQDDEMRASKSQQLQHINSWIQSVGRYTMEMQPEGVGSTLDAQDIVGHHAESLPLHDRKRVQSKEQQQFEKGSLSPPYKNQTYSEARNNVLTTTDHKQQYQLENKSMQSKKNKYDIPEVPQTPSPKPIKAIPPNVIKPQPAVRTSRKLPTTSPAASDLVLVRPATSCQALVPETKINERSDDNFGFEPLYESLSHYSHNHPNNKFKDDHRSLHLEGLNNDPSGNTVPSDPDNNQRKNAKFFKSLLKRDHKRQAGFQDNLQGNQDSHLKNASTPFTKVKNTFIHKLSGSGNARNNDSSNDYSQSNKNPGHEAATNSQEELGQGAMFYHFPNKDTVHFDNPRTDRKEKDHVNYQNICFPDPPRQHEGLIHTQTPNSLEGHPEHAENIFYRDGHESFPSTVSSLQSIRDRGRLNYQGNILHRQDGAADQQIIFDKGAIGDDGASDKPSSRYRTDNGKGSTNQSNQTRVRAPIALGSNMSISEAYGKGTENAQTQTSGSYQSSYLGSSDMNQEKTSSTSSGAKAGISDPMWIKASPVPVYKAKLIPNYENQTKYDPSFEVGLRGKAEALAPSVHAPQISISSDIYRQELQKKSEHYVAGGIYPISGQVTVGNNNLRSGPMGAPYAILPQKLNHYHIVSPTTSANNHMVNPLPDNSLNIHPKSNKAGSSKMPHDVGYNQKAKNNPENGETISSADASPKQIKQDTGNPKHNIVASSERKSAVVKACNTMPKTIENDRKVISKNFSAYRSSSAHSILERDTEPRRSDVGVNSAFVRLESQWPAEQGHKSRKDSGKAATPTSHKSHSEVISDPPQSVTSLIDRFEKKADMNHMGSLFDITDKPPSMTSTPVVRRKSQGVSTSQPSQDTPAFAKPDGNSRYKSEETERSLSQKENVSEWQRNTSTKQTGNDLSPYEQHFPKVQHQNVFSPYIQSNHKGTDRISLSQHPQDNPVDKQSTKKHKMTSNNSTPEHYLLNAQSSDLDRVPMNNKNQNQQEIYDSQAQGAYNGQMLSGGTMSGNQLKFDNTRNTNHNQKKQKSSKSSLLNTESHSLPYDLPETSTNQQGLNHYHMKSVPTPHLSSDKLQSAYSPDYSNIPYSHQLVQSSQADFTSKSPSQPQIPQSSLIIQSNITNSSQNTNEDARYKENIHYHSKLSSSAFENTSKYVRQSGAMAVVKPTVMNI